MIIGVIAGGIGTIVGIFMTEGLLFKLTFAITYLAVVWICLEAVRIPELRALIKQGYETTMRITTMVVFILIGSTCFSVVFLGVSGGVWLEHLLTSLPGGVWGFLIFINLFHLLPGVLPGFLRDRLHHPADDRADRAKSPGARGRRWTGADLVRRHAVREHADSFMHPPFGFALFYLRGVAPKEVKSSDIYWGALPWVGLQALMVILVIAFPITVTGLLDKPVNVDLNSIKIDVPQVELPPLDFGPPPKQ